MKRPAKLIASLLVAASALFAVSVHAHEISAKYPPAAILHLNSDGFAACRALGNTGYTAVARGLILGGAGDNADLSVFNVRTCFKTRAKCENFIGRIHHKIARIERLNYLRCNSRAG